MVSCFRSKPLAMLAGILLVLGVNLSLALPAPEGNTILTVTGNIEHTNIDGEAHFDYDMLMALPSRVVATHTPWTDGQRRYEGPFGRALLEAVGARGDNLTVRALDGYTAEIPTSDFYDHDVILALKRDGERMPIRELGPIFILYPFDESPGLLNKAIRFRSVWQVSSIHVD